MLHEPAAGQDEGQPRHEAVWTAHGEVAVKARRCPSCAEDNTAIAGNPYSTKVWSIKDCRSCGFTYLDPAPVVSELSETLSWSRTFEDEATSRKKRRPIGRRLSLATRWRTRLFPRRDIESLLAARARPGPVLDIGCAEGLRGRRLPEGYVPHGIEVSAELAAVADAAFAPRGGRCIHSPALEALSALGDRVFTGAMLRSFLEHEARPREVLAELLRTLEPGGVAVVKVPNYACVNRRIMGRSWCGFRFPDHVNYFTPRSLAALARTTGFEIRWRTFGKLPTSDNMWAFLTRRI